jgi:hypothetical protein
MSRISPKSPEGRDSHQCAKTGLHLVPPPGMGVWRVCKSVYGAVNPPRRDGNDVEKWCRFDLPARKTMYAATSRVAAYGECVAPLRPALGEIPFHEYFPDVAEGRNPVAEEFGESGHQAPGKIARQWRVDRCIAQVSVDDGWCVDINHLHSLAVLRRELGLILAEQHCSDLDGAVVRSANRRITIPLAQWVASQTLEDGSEPLGIRYHSRHADAWECWAIWSDLDGRVPASEVHRAAIELHDDDLCALRQLWDLWFY